MSRDRHQRRAVVHALRRKNRGRRHHDESPPLTASQFSLATLVLLVTLSSFVLAIFHYQGEAIVNGLSQVSIRATAGTPVKTDTSMYTISQQYREPNADEILPPAATFASLVIAAALGSLVARLHPDRGLYVVWFVTSAAALGLVASLSIPFEPLAETRLRWLRAEQVVATALFYLSCLVPFGVGLGWYVKFAATK